MANMGAREKKSDREVWTMELVGLVCFFKIYSKQQQQQEQTITSMHSVCEQNEWNVLANNGLLFTTEQFTSD